VPQVAIARRLGVWRGAVRAVQRELNLPTKLTWPDELKAQVRKLALDGCTTIDIARKVGIDRTSVRKIRRELDVASTKVCWPLTADQQKQLRAMTKRGMLQTEIGEHFGVVRAVIGRWQQRLGLREPYQGLPTRPKTVEIPEEAIVKLFNLGLGGVRIAKLLHVSVPTVYKVAHKHNLSNGWQQTPAENEARFIEALKNREGYIRTLAKRYSVAFCRANRLAHEILGTYRFRPGAGKPPLDSHFPQCHHEKKGKVSRCKP
jgi:DNA invertase Pin-like site-specific DNA recombinase